MQEPQKFVQNLFEETGNSKRDARNLANALTRLTGDLYTETERFIFELLQNADDLPNPKGKVDVKFVVLKEHFLILHDGQPFDYQNVEAISSISESTKSNNPEQTGYKGIGFKSVFADSECVYINSGFFSFKFDKHDKIHTNVDKTPWQIKPIWVDEKDYPSEIKQYGEFFKSPVATAIHVGREKIGEYKTKLSRLFQDPRLILFLRHVENIYVIGLTNNLKLDIKITKSKQGDKYQISRNEETTYWLVQDFEFDVPQEVRSKMEGDNKVPDKLKLVKRSKLSFAAQIKDKKLESVDEDNSVLFTYLPTNVKEYGFPFLVNADFLTTANRQEIHHDNVWNIFIFEKIGYYIFSWIAKLAKNQTYKNQITSLVPRKYTSYESETQTAFNEGFDLAIKDITFLPCENNNSRLLKVHQAIIDEIEITKVLPAESIKQFFDAQRDFISNSLANKRNLKHLQLKIFDITALCRFFDDSQEYKNLIKNNPQLNFKVIEHLFSKNVSTKDLASVPFILDEKKNIISPEELYFQIDDSEKELLNFSKFNFIHPYIDQAIQKNKKLLDWTEESLKIEVFSGEKIIRQRIGQRKYRPDNDPPALDACLNYVKFIFKYYKKLSLEYRQKLRNLELIYKQEESYYLASAESCYLSAFYKPQHPTEDIASLIGSQHFKFVIYNYCENPADISAWKEFFISIGVSDSNGLEIVHNKIIPMIANKTINSNNTINITRFIFGVCKKFNLSSEDSEVLKKLPLLTDDGLQIASQCNLSDFYTNSETETLEDIYLPNIVTQNYYRQGDSLADWRRFFTNVLGVADSQGVELIQKKIQQLADEPDLVTTYNAVAVCQQIFKFYDSLTKDDLNKLQKLNLLLVNGELAAAGICYLSNHYSPKLKLESFYENTDLKDFVSSRYCVGDTAEKEKWKNFFIDIGVAEELRFIMKSEFTLSSKEDRVKKYFRYIGFNLSQEHYTIQNFITFIHRKYLSNFDFAKKFWKYINFHWNDLKLDQKSILLINNTSQKVDSPFKFSINNDASIPCNDGKSHSSSEGIYSSRLENIVGDNFLVASCNLKDEIEKFIGLKQQLDLQDCLKLLNDIALVYHNNTNKEENRLNLIYEQLLNCIREDLNDDDREIIADWMKTGKLLACDEKFHSASQLYYLDLEMELPPKRNPNLIKFPSANLNGFEFEEILRALGIQKVSLDDMQFDLSKDVVDDSLPNLIQNRAIFIGIFLNGSRHPELEDKIKSQVQNIKFYNPSKIVINCTSIAYKESIDNYHAKNDNSIYYVRKWNNRKNINLGDYLIDALALDIKTIPSQVLLNLLDDDIEDVISYLLESGCNIEGIPDDYGKQSHSENEHELNTTSSQETEAAKSDTSSIVSSADGKGSDIDYWGKWGEDEAQKLYERLGYNAIKQDDWSALGYDFICTDHKRKKLYSEIKTITKSEPMVRLKKSQWKSMCSEDKKDNYELVIVVHEGHSVIEIIRVSSVWATLKELLSQLAQQDITKAEYTKDVEVLLGFQQNSKQSANEIIFNWQRILKSINHSHINIYPQGIVNSES